MRFLPSQSWHGRISERFESKNRICDPCSVPPTTRTACAHEPLCRASYDSGDDGDARYPRTYELSVMRSLRHPVLRLLACLAMLVLASCLATQSTAAVANAPTIPLPGFWMGFWHGVVAPV